jgi:phosphatidylserine/phosphatidylglycerophosphate/cardiolipin synthase-like enzyme
MKNIKDKIYISIIIILIGLCGQFYYSYHYRPAHEIEVYYNHDHELNEEIIQLTREADKFVYFAVYTFTRNDIKDALLAAKYRGLEVVGLTDKDQYKSIEAQASIINELKDKGIPVYFQNHSAIMHMKAIVTDKGYASGSYNWTAAATNLNDEVLEVGHDQAIRAKFQSILEEVFKKYN